MSGFQGITWHAIVVEPDQFDAQKQFVINTYGVQPAMEMDGVTVFSFPNGDVFELYTPATSCLPASSTSSTRKPKATPSLRPHGMTVAGVYSSKMSPLGK